MVLIAPWTFQRLAEKKKESLDDMGFFYGKGETHWSIVVFCPIPPNSPWIPIRLGMYGID